MVVSVLVIMFPRWIQGCTVDSKTLYRLHSIKHGVEFWSGVIGWSIDIYMG